MANEITLSINITFAKGGSEESFRAADAMKIDVTGSRFMHNRQEIGTSEEAIDIGDVSTGGYFVAVNRDVTNFVEIRSGTGTTDVVKLKAGEACAFRMSADSNAPFALADTAPVELEYLLIED